MIHKLDNNYLFNQQVDKNLENVLRGNFTLMVIYSMAPRE